MAGIGEERKSVNIWGPSDLKYLIDAMRSFIPNAAMVHTPSFGSTVHGDKTDISNSEVTKMLDPIVVIDDKVVNVVKITAILLHPNSSEECGLQGSKGKAGTLKPGDIAVVYVCELPEIKGEFDPVKAEALGLKPGPKCGELKAGKSVKSDLIDDLIVRK